MSSLAVTVFEPGEILWTAVLAAAAVGVVFTCVPVTRTPARIATAVGGTLVGWLAWTSLFMSPTPQPSTPTPPSSPSAGRTREAVSSCSSSWCSSSHSWSTAVNPHHESWEWPPSPA